MQIVKFAELFAMVYNELIRVFAEHGCPAGLMLVRAIGRAFVDDVVVFTSQAFVMLVARIFTCEDGYEGFAMGPFERDVGKFGEGGSDVNKPNEAGCAVVLEDVAWPGDDEGNAHKGFVEATVFAGKSVVSECFTVVTHENDHGIFALAGLFERFNHSVDVVIDERDHAIIRSDVVLFFFTGRIAFFIVEVTFEVFLYFQIAFSK